MGDLININTDGNLMNILHGSGEVALPKPFARDIYLFSTKIAGTSHVTGIDELVERLELGTQLRFVREPDNAYDSNAILIKTQHGIKIGYVPRADNIIFARLMDAGKLILGKVMSKEKENKWWHIKIDIFLHE